jgi:hypothetical protein
MDLLDVARSCFRRWYVFVPLLLIVAWYSHSVYRSVAPVYYSQAVIGIAPPSDKVADAGPGIPVPRNGLLDVGGASLIANLTALGLQQPAVVDRVVSAGGVANYSSKMFPQAANFQPLPLIMVEITDADPAAATRTLDLLIEQAPATLRNLQQQAQVPAEQMVTPFVVSPPSAPAAAMPSRTRSTVAIFAAGAGLSVLITVLLDVLLTRRKSRAEQRRPTEVVGEPDPARSPIDSNGSNNAVVAAERG